jgi:MFS family permease
VTTRDPHAARRVLPLQWSTGMASIGDGAFRASAPLIAASLTSDPRAVSLVSVASYAAWFTGLFAGALTDRWPRRATLIRTDLVRAACLLVLVVLILLGQASVPLVVVMAFLMTTGTVFFDSSGQAILPSIVGRDIDLLSRQNGRLHAAETTGRSFAGIPLGSVTFALGAAAPFALGSIAYLCSSLTLRGLPRDPDAAPGARHESLVHEIRTGFAHLGRDRPLFAMSLSTAAFNFADAVAMAVFVLYARTVLGVPDWVYGLLLVCVAVGSVAGGMLSGRLGRFRWSTVALVAAAVQSAGWVVIVTTRSPWLTGVMLALMGTGASAATVSVVSTRQARVPDRLLGRVVAGFRVVGNGSAIAGAAAGGLIAASFGLVAAPWAAAGFLFVAALPLCWLAGRRRGRRA